MPYRITRPDANGLSHFITGDLGSKVFNEVYFQPLDGRPLAFHTATANVTGATVAPVPEPSTLAMMLVGGLSLAGVQAFRRRLIA